MKEVEKVGTIKKILWQIPVTYHNRSCYENAEVGRDRKVPVFSPYLIIYCDFPENFSLFIPT